MININFDRKSFRKTYTMRKKTTAKKIQLQTLQKNPKFIDNESKIRTAIQEKQVIKNKKLCKTQM